MTDAERMFITKENEPEIRRIVKSEITHLIISYTAAGFAIGLLVGYIVCIIEALFK